MNVVKTYYNNKTINSIGVYIAVFVCFITTMSGQHIDESSIVQKLEVPAVLLITGWLINGQSIKTDIQQFAIEDIGRVETTIDDYLQYAGVASVLGYSLATKNRKHFKHLAIAGMSTMALTYGLKNITKENRPMGGSRSLPSGHTSFAFFSSAVLHRMMRENGSPWAWIAYVPATATGVLRVLRNKHWASDVLIGAGIGILSTELSYHFFNETKVDSPTSDFSSAMHFDITSTGVAISYTF